MAIAQIRNGVLVQGTGTGTIDTSGTPVDNDLAKFTDANTLEGRSYAELKADLNLEIGTDVLAEQTIGIANDNLVEMDDADAADNDYCKLTANGIEGRSYAETLSDLSGEATGAFDWNGQDISNLGDLIVAAGKALASGATNGNTLLIKANDTTFITLTTGTTDAMQLEQFTANGDILKNYVKTSAAYQIAAGVHFVGVDTDTAARTITVPSASIAKAGWSCIVKDVDQNAATNNITIATEGAETIDEAATYTVSTNGGSVGLFSDGSNLHVV